MKALIQILIGTFLLALFAGVAVSLGWWKFLLWYLLSTIFWIGITVGIILIAIGLAEIRNFTANYNRRPEDAS